MKRANWALAALALLAVPPAFVRAQKPVTETAAIEVTTEIVGLDKTTRLVTIKGPDGLLDTIYAGPEVKRFDELKVGQKVNLTYYESVVFQLVKAGEKGSGASVGATANRGTGALPSATIATQETMTVTVKAIDATVPSVTVATDDGRVVTRKIENMKNLENVKPGDKIDITFTQALVTSVSPAD